MVWAQEKSKAKENSPAPTPAAPAQEKLLDKIVAVINTKVISLSEINRIAETLDARREVSPIIYTAPKYKAKELVEIMLRSFIVRDKISAQGYVINDDAVESRIKESWEHGFNSVPKPNGAPAPNGIGANNNGITSATKGKIDAYVNGDKTIEITKFFASLSKLGEQDAAMKYYALASKAKSGK